MGDGRLHVTGMNESESCPVCRNERFLDPTMIILVSPCYHKMCQACVNRIFAMGAAPCPFCKVILRKTNFVKPTFEDLEVEKEVRIRRRIYKIIEDFAGDKMTFNSYLEEVEDIIHNLVHEHDVQLQNARIEEYLRANAASIQKNIDRQRDEDNAIFRALEEEIRDYHLRKKADDNELIQEMQNLSSKKHLNMSSTEVDTTILQNKSVVSQVLRRGPALMDRLNVNISAGRKSHFVADNPFSDPLKSPYLRFNNLTCAHLSFYDPAQSTFTSERSIAGGYSIKRVQLKALESAQIALFVVAPVL